MSFRALSNVIEQQRTWSELNNRLAQAKENRDFDTEEQVLAEMSNHSFADQYGVPESSRASAQLDHYLNGTRYNSLSDIPGGEIFDTPQWEQLSQDPQIFDSVMKNIRMGYSAPNAIYMMRGDYKSVPEKFAQIREAIDGMRAEPGMQQVFDSNMIRDDVDLAMRGQSYTLDPMSQHVEMFDERAFDEGEAVFNPQAQENARQAEMAAQQAQEAARLAQQEYDNLAQQGQQGLYDFMQQNGIPPQRIDEAKGAYEQFLAEQGRQSEAAAAEEAGRRAREAEMAAQQAEQEALAAQGEVFDSQETVDPGGQHSSQIPAEGEGGSDGNGGAGGNGGGGGLYTGNDPRGNDRFAYASSEDRTYLPDYETPTGDARVDDLYRGYAPSVEGFIDEDYETWMAETLRRRNEGTDSMLDDYRAAQGDVIADTYDTDLLGQRQEAVLDAARQASQGMTDTMQTGQAIADARYRQAAGQTGSQLTGAADTFSGQQGEAADAYGKALTGAATDLGTGLGAASDAYGTGMAGAASDYGTDTTGAAQDFADTTGASAADYATRLAGIGAGQQAAQASNAQGAVDTAQDLYGGYQAQAANSQALLDRMAGQDYSSQLMQRRLDQTSDDIRAQMNATGLGRSGAALEALADARADIVAEQADRDWQRDAQLAQMTGNYGLQGAGAQQAAAENYAGRMQGAIDQSTGLAAEGAGALYGTELAGQEQLLGAKQQAAGTALDAAQKGTEAEFATGQAGVQAGFDAANQGAAAGLAGSQAGSQAQLDAAGQAANNMAMANRDVYGAGTQNVGRQFDADLGFRDMYSQVMDSHYGDLFRNQQAAGQAAYNLNQDLQSNDLTRLQQFYGDLLGLRSDVAKFGAQADIDARAREAAAEGDYAASLSNLYNNAAGQYTANASGLYDLGGQLGMSGISSMANLYGNKNKKAGAGGRSDSSASMG